MPTFLAVPERGMLHGAGRRTPPIVPPTWLVCKQLRFGTLRECLLPFRSPMSRLHYLAALLFLGLSLLILGASRPAYVLDIQNAPRAGTAEGWFTAIRPNCNTLEVDLAFRQSPPPQGTRGAGFAAACLALADRIDEARDRIMSLAPDDRSVAAGIVFDVGHPVADAGDDRSAGPIMGLVVEFWPNHYMALYHAGMARYATGDLVLAQSYLDRFLRFYEPDDGWRRNAVTVLQRLSVE